MKRSKFKKPSKLELAENRALYCEDQLKELRMKFDGFKKELDEFRDALKPIYSTFLELNVKFGEVVNRYVHRQP